MSVMIRKAHVSASHIKWAWTKVQTRNKMRARLKAHRLAEPVLAARRRTIHTIASKAISGALELDNAGRVPEPSIHVALVGLADLHYYIANPDVEMPSDVATAVLQTIDNVIDEIHSVFRRATKAGGRL